MKTKLVLLVCVMIVFSAIWIKLNGKSNSPNFVTTNVVMATTGNQLPTQKVDGVVREANGAVVVRTRVAFSFATNTTAEALSAIPPVPQN